jgi:hypothetical protein
MRRSSYYTTFCIRTKLRGVFLRSRLYTTRGANLNCNQTDWENVCPLHSKHTLSSVALKMSHTTVARGHLYNRRARTTQSPKKVACLAQSRCSPTTIAFVPTQRCRTAPLQIHVLTLRRLKIVMSLSGFRYARQFLGLLCFR